MKRTHVNLSFYCVLRKKLNHQLATGNLFQPVCQLADLWLKPLWWATCCPQIAFHTQWMRKSWMCMNMNDNTHTSLWLRCQNTIMNVKDEDSMCIHVAHLHAICWCIQRADQVSGWLMTARCLMMADDGLFLCFSHLRTDTGSNAAHSLFHFPFNRRASLPPFLSYIGLNEYLYKKHFPKQTGPDMNAGMKVKHWLMNFTPIFSICFMQTTLFCVF